VSSITKLFLKKCQVPSKDGRMEGEEARRKMKDRKAREVKHYIFQSV
jgi:hypothetical protein